MYFSKLQTESNYKAFKNQNRVFKLQNTVCSYAPKAVLTKLYAVLCKVNHIWGKKIKLCIYSVPKAEEMFSLVILRIV